MIRWKQQAQGFADFGLHFRNPDLVEYAKAYGANGRRVRATEDLAPILESALRKRGIHLIVVPVDYSENQRVLIDELASRPARLD